MVIDTGHMHHWMNAIRVLNNPMRTLDNDFNLFTEPKVYTTSSRASSAYSKIPKCKLT